MFQLSESQDIERVTLILNALAMKSKESLQVMRKKYKVEEKVLGVL